MPTRIVLCAREMHAPAWLEALRAALPDADLWWRDAAKLDADPLAPQADIAIVWRPPPALFEEQRRLRAVFNLGAGVDALLAMPAFPRDALLVRLEDAGMADALAEYVLAAVLRVYRGFDRYAIRQRDARWQAEVLRPRSNFTVGVLGLGVIGTAIARALAAHGFAVRGFARTRHTIEGVDCRAGDAEFASFLDGLDALASVLPLTADNRGILNRANLARLADGAHVINVGRGAHLVEADLLALLDEGKLGGATLDVFETEPLPADHPFWRRPEILITPHISAVTELEPSVAQIAEKIARLERGEAITGVVDLRRGY
ncbi:MAG: glyoxylate/hydroxypyruvate reductase A [Betaproteobacteria bacterium]|nr:MAG: glyoxylate/hydroxypyruvate reductase A [Betaproteobacteria bacterium]